MFPRSTVTLLSALAVAVGFGLIATAPADAASKKKRIAGTAVSSKVTRARPVARGPDLYNGLDYLGTDPDPNIRAWLIKDLSGRYGGSY